MRKKTREEHVAEIAIHGRVELIGSYTNNYTKTLYRCREHNLEALALPMNIRKGAGLSCCRKDALKQHWLKHKKRTVLSYDKRLAEINRIERVGEFEDWNTHIAHRCLKHNEIHHITPSHGRSGAGLRCCREEGWKKGGQEKVAAASIRYDRALLRHGKVRRIGTYSGTRVAILHKCLLHGEIHLAKPGNCYSGQGLLCCRSDGSEDSIGSALAGSGRYSAKSPCSLYICELANHLGYLKPGIAKDCAARADKEYGPQVCSWEREHRTLVFLVEQVLLRDTRLVAQCPSALAGWSGATEVRRMEADALVAMAQELMDELDSCANPWEFAIAHGLLTKDQEKRAHVLIRAGVISEAELPAACAA